MSSFPFFTLSYFATRSALVEASRAFVRLLLKLPTGCRA